VLAVEMMVEVTLQREYACQLNAKNAYNTVA
jgi:hypothetical protein